MELVGQLSFLSEEINLIIIVDSSDQPNILLTNYPQVLYLTTPIKNQPYQRWLGHSNSKADVLLFLDDDMEVATDDCIKIISSYFVDKMVAGIAINFVDKHSDTSLAAIPTSQFAKNNRLLKRIINFISGYPNLPDGKLGLCGVRGRQPANGGDTEWVSGGAFAAQRVFLFKNFNYQLFDLFKHKIGMGEDVIIGYGLSKQGILLYAPQLLFYHNDQKDSAYSMDHFAYAKRVIFSRLYLSMEKQRLQNGSYLYAKLHYHWYVLWRLGGLLINYLIKRNTVRYNLLKGSFAGWKLAYKFKFNKYGADISGGKKFI